LFSPLAVFGQARLEPTTRLHCNARQLAADSPEKIYLAGDERTHPFGILRRRNGDPSSWPGEVYAMKAVHRLATLNDTNRLFDLRRQSIIKLAAKGMSIEEAARWAEELTVAGMERKICELEIWIAELSEKVVGWGAIRGDRLEGLYMDPEFAGRGIGTELLGLLEGLMQERGVPAVRAEASSNAEVFYLRRGYERTDPSTSEGAQPIRKQLS
jgi:putative acetyltransferase